MPSKDVKQRYYYDACTLDLPQTYVEIINGKNSQDAVVSHLALGEAYGNTLRKSDEALKAFQELIRELNSKSLIQIVGNDKIEVIVSDIQQEIERIDITDAMHFATAVREKCRVFKTSDPDFCGCPSKKFEDVAKKHGVENFSICEVHLPISKYSKKQAKKIS